LATSSGGSVWRQIGDPAEGAQVRVDHRVLLVARALVLAAQAEGY